MSESKENEPCGCMNCLQPELFETIWKDKMDKLTNGDELMAETNQGDVGDPDMNTFYGNHVNSNGVTVNTSYIGCNNNFIWNLIPDGFDDADESTWFDFLSDDTLRRKDIYGNLYNPEERISVIKEVEAVFQVWDDVIGDNMLGYDANGKKNKVYVTFYWGATSGNTIAYAGTTQWHFPTKTQEYYPNGTTLKPLLEWGNAFAWRGLTLFGAQGYSSWATDDQHIYKDEEWTWTSNYTQNPQTYTIPASVHKPIYLPRLQESIVQNKFIRVMVHEIGHIMGLSATWGPYRSVKDREYTSIWQKLKPDNQPITSYIDTSDSNKTKFYWSGENSVKYYKGYFDTNSSGTTVNLLGPPIEDLSQGTDDQGNPIYINRHWEEGGNNRQIPDSNGNNVAHPYLDKELMTPYAEGNVRYWTGETYVDSNGITRQRVQDVIPVDMPFSLVCIGALQDAGYNFVNYFKGEPYPLRSGYDRKTPLDLLATNIYVRQNSDPFSDPHYLFSTTPNGSALNSSTVKLPLQRTQTYRFIRHEPDSGTQHPFNVGTGWRTNNSTIEVTSDGTGTAVSGPNGSSANSIVHGQELSFTVPTNYGWDSEEFKYFCYAHGSMIDDFLLTAAPCFDESTKILCLRDDKEEQVLVSELKEGDLVVTYKHGALPILKIGKATLLFNSNPDYRQTIYRLKKTDEMTDDLLVTGRHGILLDDWSTHVTEESRSLEPHTKIDDKVLLSAGYCNLFTAEKEPKTHTIYHFALEGEQRRYGIYANGALMETWDKQSKDVNLQK